MRRSIALILLCCAGAAAAEGPYGTPVHGYLFSEGLSAYVDEAWELWGYMDKSGKPVIAPRFIEAGPFSGGLARVVVESDHGERLTYFIDKKGQVAIDPQKGGFKAYHDFSEGLALVSFADGHPGFIDAKGRLALDLPGLVVEQPFSEGLAVIGVPGDGSYSYGYIDAKGRHVIPPVYTQADSFSQGLALVGLPDGSPEKPDYAFIDKAGRLVFKPSAYAYPFSDGASRKPPAYGATSRTWVFLDASGKTILENSTYAFIGDFSQGLAPVGYDEGPFGFIDKTGRLALPIVYQAVNRFSEGLAAVQKDDAIGFIGPNGKTALAFAFCAILPGDGPEGGYDLSAYSFHEGLCAYLDRASGNWGYLDASGKTVIKAAYHEAGPFSCGLAKVGLWDEETGMSQAFIDKTGKIAFIASGYRVYSDFRDGLALAILDDGRAAFVNAKGEIAFVPPAGSSYPFSEGLVPFSRDEAGGRQLWGYIDAKGRTAIEPRFIQASSFSDGVARVILPGAEGRYAYIDKTGRILFQRDEILFFSDGLAISVREDGAGGETFVYIDKSGKEVLSLSGYSYAGAFFQGRALVRRGRSSYGFIDKRGAEIVAPSYKGAADYSEGLAAVVIGRKVGFIGLDGKVAIKPVYAAPVHVFGKGGGW